MCDKKQHFLQGKKPSVPMHEPHALVLNGIMLLKRNPVVRSEREGERESERASKWEHAADSIKRHGGTFAD